MIRNLIVHNEVHIMTRTSPEDSWNAFHINRQQLKPRIQSRALRKENQMNFMCGMLAVTQKSPPPLKFQEIHV